MTKFTDLALDPRVIQAVTESGYLELTLRASALRAAEVALKVARVNYEAAEEARRLGAASLSEVINAQLALVTANSKFLCPYFSQSGLCVTSRRRPSARSSPD